MTPLTAHQVAARLRGQASVWRFTASCLDPQADAARIRVLWLRADAWEMRAQDLEAVAVEEQAFEARARAAA